MTPRTKSYFRDKALASWGPAAPEWVLALADAADKTDAAKAAAQLGYSGAVVSSVLGGKYSGNLDLVATRVRAVLMKHVVECPVIGELALSRCLEEQGRTHTTTDHYSMRMYRACQACPNNRKNQETTDDATA